MTSASKEFKMHRSTADRLRKEVEERIRSFNADNRRTLCVTRAVIFGSYVNDPGKEMLSDLDVGLEMGNRFEGETHRRCADEERIRTRRVTPSVADDFMVYMAIPENNLLKHIRNRSKYISLHLMSETENKAIFGKEALELDVGEINRTVPFVSEPVFMEVNGEKERLLDEDIPFLTERGIIEERDGKLAVSDRTFYRRCWKCGRSIPIDSGSKCECGKYDLTDYRGSLIWFAVRGEIFTDPGEGDSR